eukprot:COSAG02_NODE_40085_length_409_cov_1.000000_1_plen_55_part_01
MQYDMAHGRTLWVLTALPREPLVGLVLQFHQPFDCDMRTRSMCEFQCALRQGKHV